MALPLPNVVPDVGPGGPLVSAMQGQNALAQNMLRNQILGVQAQYAPLTTQAEAASKLAYANLMGPQFLAKFMGNQDILANISDPQKRQAVNLLLASGMGQGTGNALLGNQPTASNPNNSLKDLVIDKIKNVFNAQPQAPQQQINPLSYFANQPQLTDQDRQGIAALQPGNDVRIQASKPESSLPTQATQQPTFAENVGNYKGTVAEGEEAGKIRANDIKELNDIVFNADSKLATLNDINDMISSPEIREIRQMPLLGRHEMGWYAKEGTPQQQQLVGRLYAQMGNIIKDSSRDFAGQFRKGEQQLLQGMKPSDSDTVDTMIGKAESLSVMTQLLRERAALTSKYMTEGHINKLQAQELADKQINADKIRQQVHDKLNPTIRIRNKKTGEIKTIPINEARELGVPNV